MNVTLVTHYGFAVILQVTEYSGFLWDSSSGIEMKDATVLENSATNGNGKHPHPRPYLGHFYVSKPGIKLYLLVLPSNLFNAVSLR